MATKTLNIALDEKLIKEIDKTVTREMGSRSEYFRRLALRDLEKRREWKELFDGANKKGRKLGIDSQEKVDKTLDEYKIEKQK